jgi:hypothetical protein
MGRPSRIHWYVNGPVPAVRVAVNVVPTHSVAGPSGSTSTNGFSAQLLPVWHVPGTPAWVIVMSSIHQPVRTTEPSVDSANRTTTSWSAQAERSAEYCAQVRFVPVKYVPVGSPQLSDVFVDVPG